MKIEFEGKTVIPVLQPKENPGGGDEGKSGFWLPYRVRDKFRQNDRKINFYACKHSIMRNYL